MKVSFPVANVSDIVKNINDQLQSRELGKIASIEQKGNDIVVTLSKLGTSTLIFSFKSKNGTCDGELTSEKIALTHRAFKDDVKNRLMRVIEKAGGKVEVA